MVETVNISKAEIYAVHYLDNGGKAKDFSKRHLDLYKAIQEEEKRRIMIQIRYKMSVDKTLKKKIYKKFGFSKKDPINPTILYSKLVNLSNNLLLSFLHARN